MRAWLFDAQSGDWSTQIERAYALLSVEPNPTLFPYHFLHSLLARIGGGLAYLGESLEHPVGIGFLFPRSLGLPPSRVSGSDRDGREFTLRYHGLGAESSAHVQLPDAEQRLIVAAVEAQLPQGRRVVYYDPGARHRYNPTYQAVGQVNIGRPSATEASAIRELHRAVWGSAPEFLYPADIHSLDFRPGTSLIARVDEQPAGFLFGFYKFEGPTLPADWYARFRGELRLESQTMGVLPEYRGMRIANSLKRIQAEQAAREGIGIVHWTADPLQAPNGALNFGLLRAIAFRFYPDFYPFRNELNRVPASRFGLTWLVRTARVQEEVARGTPSRVVDLSRQPAIQRVNDSYDWTDLGADAPVIAFEIPADWTHLQRHAVDRAQRWRETTDALFAHYIGIEEDKYAVTGVGADGERRFLIAEQVNDALWTRLAQE
jgi:predicted GNAT superfamily acetyltransferase